MVVAVMKLDWRHLAPCAALLMLVVFASWRLQLGYISLLDCVYSETVRQ